MARGRTGEEYAGKKGTIPAGSRQTEKRERVPWV